MKSPLNTLLLIAAIALLLVPAPAMAQKKKAGNDAQTASTTAARFNLQNPFDKINDNISGTPWDHCETQKLPELKGVTPSTTRGPFPSPSRA